MASHALGKAMLAVFVAALLFHGLIGWQYGQDPFFETPVSDALSYHRWADRIATDGLSAEPVFHQSPLFPILLGQVYRAAGEQGRPTAALLLQILLSSAAVSLLVPLGSLYFGSRRAGIFAAVLALLHGPLVFYAMKLLPIPLALATQAGALVALGLARRRAGGWTAALTGAAWGLAVLARAEMLLFQPLVWLAVWTSGPPDRTARMRRVGLCAACTFLVLLPVTLHNRRQGDTVLVAAAGGENLFIGNQRGGDGGHTPLHPQAGDLFSQRALAQRIAEEQSGGPLRPSQVSSYWRSRALQEIAAAPGAWLRLELKKLGRILHPGDPTDIYSFTLERGSFLWGLYLAWVPPWVLWLLAALGLLQLRGRFGSAWPVAALVTAHLGVLMLFFVSTRLRLPLLFFLAPFAGLAVERVAADWNDPSRRLQARAVAAVVLVLALLAPATAQVSPRERLRLASVLSTQNRLDESLSVLAPLTGDAGGDALALDQAGWVLYKSERWDEAVRRYRQALELGLPGARETQTRTRLAWALEKTGETAAAREQHDAAVAGTGANAGTYYERGLFRMRNGDGGGAVDDLREAIRRDPGWPPPQEALRRLEGG